LRLAQERTPAVILLDVSMPVMDGRATVRALKADLTTMNVPTLAITAVVSLHNRGELEAVGFDAVLLKPVLPAIVVTAVRQAIAAREAPRTS
jgi:CheY-like chemotaxis protein